MINTCLLPHVFEINVWPVKNVNFLEEIKYKNCSCFKYENHLNSTPPLI